MSSRMNLIKFESGLINLMWTELDRQYVRAIEQLCFEILDPIFDKSGQKVHYKFFIANI